MTGSSRLKVIGVALIVVGLGCLPDSGALAAPAAGPRPPAPPQIDVSGASTIEYDAAAQGEASPDGDAAQDGRWATFSAETVEADDRPDTGQIVATGQVAILRGSRQLRADRIVYDRMTRRGTADGHAVLAQGADRLQADHLAADL